MAQQTTQPQDRPSLLAIRGVALMTTVLIIGAIFLAIGISNVVDASEIASHGVQVRAVVLGVPKGGPSNSTEVGYTTASGQREQGVLGGVSYLRVGSAITVVYDPVRPSVVALPGASSEGAWQQVVAGSASLLIFFFFLVSWRVRPGKER